MTTDETSLQKPGMPDSAGVLYRLSVAFPAWAGAMLAFYTILLRFGGGRMRPR